MAWKAHTSHHKTARNKITQHDKTLYDTSHYISAHDSTRQNNRMQHSTAHHGAVQHTMPQNHEYQEVPPQIQLWPRFVYQHSPKTQGLFQYNSAFTTSAKAWDVIQCRIVTALHEAPAHSLLQVSLTHELIWSTTWCLSLLFDGGASFVLDLNSILLVTIVHVTNTKSPHEYDYCYPIFLWPFKRLVIDLISFIIVVEPVLAFVW